MAKDIWFVPTAPAHPGKFAPLASAFRDRGDHVHHLCVDSILRPTEAALDRIEGSGDSFKVLPPIDCDVEPGRFQVPRHRREVVRAFRELLGGESIDVMIMASVARPPRRALIRAMSACGIPCVYIPDGVQTPVNPRYLPPRLTQQRYGFHSVFGLIDKMGLGPTPGNSGVDLVLCPGDTAREVLIQRWKFDARIVHAVGAPEYDRYAANESKLSSTEQLEAICQRLGLDPKRPVVFYAAQSLSHEPLIQDMMPAVRHFEGTLLVKFHPRTAEDLDRWRRWADEQQFGPQEIVFAKDEVSAIEALQVCSVCVTVFSTVSLEAMIFGAPLVVIQYYPCRDTLPFGEKYHAAFDAENPEELQRGIVMMVTDEEARTRLLGCATEALKHELMGPDGRSAQRVLDHIDALLRHGAE